MKTQILLILLLISGLSYCQNVTTATKQTVKIFTGKYDSGENKTDGRMKLEIRQAKTAITGTINFKNADGKTTGDLEMTGYVQNGKAHIRIMTKTEDVVSAVLSIEGEALVFSLNGTSVSFPKNISLLRI